MKVKVNDNFTEKIRPFEWWSVDGLTLLLPLRLQIRCEKNGSLENALAK